MQQISKYWQIIFTLAAVIFNVGYTVNELNHKPSKEEIQGIVKEEIQYQIKDRYVKIEDGVSLDERLKNIEKNVDEQKQLTQKIYDRLLSK